MVDGHWREHIPWTFRDLPKRPSYEERRKMRYALQDYMDWFGDYKGKRVLEVGSGSGLDSCEFARNGAKVTATDATENGVAETKITMSEAGLRFPIKQVDAAHLTFPSDSFDLVYCFGVVHHLSLPRYAVQEFARVAPEFLGMVYSRDSLLYAYSIEHLGLDFEMFGPTRSRAYTKKEVIRLFGEFYPRVSVEPYYNVIDTPSRRKVKLNIPNELGLGWHYVVRAKRP